MSGVNSVENVQNWFDAVQMYDQGIVEEALDKFREVNKSAKILFNIGCCYLKLEEIDNAVRKYNEAIKLDPHLAIAYFMLGLTNFLDEEYSEAMKYFEKSFEKLRGNRFVDYRQLGFKYQLYSCEILTNQAVCAYKQKKIGQAKGLLLQAVGCKAEKKHESIVESLSLLQSGYPISPFIPPQSEIFRPPKAAVANLKKKNYLGKAKVISTENTEEIYACFSGIKDQVNSPAEPVSRGKLLTEIKAPERKSTLRHVPRPPKSRPAEFGRVVESSPSGKNRPPPSRGLPSVPKGGSPPDSPPLPSRRLPPSPSRSPPPTRSTSGRTAPRGKLPDMPGSSMSLPPRSSLPPAPPSPEERRKPPSRPPPQQIVDRNNNYSDDDDGETYEEIDDRNVKYKPANRPPPQLPKRKESVDTDESLPPVLRARLPSNPVPNRRPPSIVSQASMDQPPEKPPHNRQRKESSISKPGRTPPPPPPNEDETVSVSPRKYLSSPPSSLNNSQNDAEFKNEINNVLKKNKTPNEIVTSRKKSSSVGSPITVPPRKESDTAKAATLPPGKSAGLPAKSPTSPSKPPPIRSDSKLNYEIEVQYTFVQKLSVPDGISLEDLEELVKEKGVPDDIELCFNDDLGRQQTLTAKKMKRVFDQDNSSVKKLYCFPDS